jgi:hypothetical protein
VVAGGVEDFDRLFACTTEDWAGTGHRVTDNKVTDMLSVLIPMAVDNALASGRRFSGPANARAVHKIVDEAGGYKPPVRHEAEVCRRCHHLRLEQDACHHCPGIRMKLANGKSQIVAVVDWGMESVMIWDLRDLVREWLQDEEVAPMLLNHLRDISCEIKHEALRSERAEYYRGFLRKLGGDERNLLLSYHSDGFAPIKTRPNSFSLTYGILSALLGPTMSYRRSAMKVWLGLAFKG